MSGTAVLDLDSFGKLQIGLRDSEEVVARRDPAIESRSGVVAINASSRLSRRPEELPTR